MQSISGSTRVFWPAPRRPVRFLITVRADYSPELRFSLWRLGSWTVSPNIPSVVPPRRHAIPEPSTWALVALGGGLFWFVGRRRRESKAW